MPSVMTVLGPIESDKLGVTLAHEHIFIDLACLWHAPKDKRRDILVDAPLSLETRGLLMCDPYHSRTNMVLDDAELAVQELGYFKALGGGTVVDLSARTIGPYPQKLQEVASRTGLNIIAGTGFYTKRAHPDWLSSSSVSQLAEHMIRELHEGIDGTSARAGVIGEVGSSSPIHPDEVKSLQAAAAAHHATGAAINVHLAIFGKQGHRVLDILEEQSVDPAYVTLSHLDETGDLQYQRDLASRGCFVEFDCFGSEVHFDEDQCHEPSDTNRIDNLIELIELGYEKQLLLSQDVCTKMQLRKFGGFGYDHILRTIVPRLRARGVEQRTIDKMLMENPARFLAGVRPAVLS